MRMRSEMRMARMRYLVSSAREPSSKRLSTSRLTLPRSASDSAPRANRGDPWKGLARRCVPASTPGTIGWSAIKLSNQGTYRTGCLQDIRRNSQASTIIHVSLAKEAICNDSHIYHSTISRCTNNTCYKASRILTTNGLIFLSHVGRRMTLRRL